MDRGARGPTGQAEHRGRGALHRQGQRQGQEGQVVSQKPGRNQYLELLFCCHC